MSSSAAPSTFFSLHALMLKYAELRQDSRVFASLAVKLATSYSQGIDELSAHEVS